MTEAQLITPPISITGQEGVVRDKGVRRRRRRRRSADKKMKRRAGCNKGGNEEWGEERRGGMKESPSCRPRGFWTGCSITPALIALWLGGVADESDSLPQWVTLRRDADGIVIVWCCSQLCGPATGCDHSSLNLWGTTRCFLILTEFLPATFLLDPNYRTGFYPPGHTG